MFIGLPLVFFYHLFCSSVFFNTQFEDAKGIEKVANQMLAPVQYLCEGKQIIKTQDGFQIVQKFDYKNQKFFNSVISFSGLLQGFTVGSVLKSISFLSRDVRLKHEMLRNQIESTAVYSNNDFYKSIGIEINDFRQGEWIDTPKHDRRPGDENNLALHKDCLKEIVNVLTAAKIPFWMDCGTCLGAYRYGGVIPWDYDLDIQIFEHDSQNVLHALQALDKKKFHVQNWSSRTNENTYIRIYIKQANDHIDFYHAKIHPMDGTISTILSHADSNFMFESWKIRERRYSTPNPYSAIFPLKKALFDGILVPVPNQTKKYLQSKYGEDISPAKLYSEVTGHYENDPAHPYWNLDFAH